MTSNKNIFIFGNYGLNTGDNAMLFSLLSHYKYYSLELFILSNIPLNFLPSSKKINFVEYNPLNILNSIRKSSIFIMGGGTPFFDYGSSFKRFKILFILFLIILWAKIFTNKIYFIGTGIETPSTKWGYFIMENMHKLADLIILRDSFSYNVLKQMKLKKDPIISFDLASLLEIPEIKKSKEKVIGISILPINETKYNNPNKDLLFITKIASALDYWLDLNNEYNLKIFIFSKKEEHGDLEIIKTLQKMMKNKVEVVKFDPNPLNITKKVAECEFFLGMRYHSCLFAYITETPLIMIETFEKTLSLANDVKLPSAAVISIDEILKGDLKDYLQKIHTHPEKFRAIVPVKEMKKLVKSSLDLI